MLQRASTHAHAHVPMHAHKPARQATTHTPHAPVQAGARVGATDTRTRASTMGMDTNANWCAYIYLHWRKSIFRYKIYL